MNYIIISHSSYPTLLGLEVMIRKYPDTTIIDLDTDPNKLFPLKSTTVVELIVINYTSKEGGNIGLIERVKLQTPNVKVLMLSEIDSFPRLNVCLNLGIEGYMCIEDCTEVSLQTAFQKILSGETYFSSKYLRDVFKAYAKMKVVTELTPREMEVVELVTSGLTNPEVAKQLFISTKTVEAHRNRVRRKLGIEGGGTARFLKGVQDYLAV